MPARLPMDWTSPGFVLASRPQSRHIPIPYRPHQRRAAAAEADLPDDGMGRHAVRPDAAEVDAAQVVPGADGHAVLARVVAARRAIDDVMVVQRGTRGARRDGAAPAVACEDRVAVRRLGLPLATHVLKDLLAALPERRARWTEGVEGAAEQRHDRRGRGERDVGTKRLVMLDRKSVV